jgi:hypothetical protein
MIKGLLRPRSDESRPWLMPIMRASRGALHGGRKQLYPKKTIWVDAAAEEQGDGSAKKPLQSLDDVLADDTLECVCQALCCDKYTVRVKGAVSVEVNATASSSAEDAVTVVDGHGRDYAQRLVIRPWGDSERLQLKATLRTHIAVSENNQVDFRQCASVVKALRGVMWVDTDILIDLVIVCDREPEDIRIHAFAELGGWDDCADSIFMNCTVMVRTRVDVLMKIPYQGDYIPPAPGDGGGGGGGGGGGTYPWPTQPGAPGGGTYPWPGEPPVAPAPSPWAGDWNAATIVFGVRNSSGVIARGGTLDLVALAQSNWGALAECRGFVNCPNSDLAGVAIKTVALAEASGSGRVYQSADGGSGVARYQLTAAAHARDVARCPRSALTALLGESSAKALTFPGNQPHHVDPSGSRTDYAVGGYALAEDYGVFSCREAACDALDHTVYAKASHSEHYGQRACPYAGNEGASFSACTGRGGQCKSNRAEWCADAGGCDAV